MNPFAIPILDLVGKVFDRIFPDPAQKAAAQLEVLKMQQTGELAQLQADLQLATGQMATNTEEAKSSSTFVAGWRPFIGWVCGTGFAIQFVIGPLFTWGSALVNHLTVFPKLDLSDMLPILFGMLGLGAYRTYEKVKGAN